MKTLKILDDQPADSASDQLHFYRFINAIENKVLDREDTKPFVVGVYGKWGYGKSTLLRMLAEKLKEEPEKWEIVEFSPWMYRNEKSLLLPLLATLSKKRSIFENLIKEITKTGPKFIKTLSTMGIDAATTGLPLITFLSSIHKEKEKAKDMGEKIAEAVNAVTKDKKQMVFLIDDLDRCHDPVQIIGLLEQIKLFLHLDRCIFFICADREQIIKAINKIFPGEGEEYLDKFVQLPLEINPHQSHHLIGMLGIEDKELRHYVMRISEVLDHNPRKLKKLLNQAAIGMEIVKEEMGRVQSFTYDASPELMLKWLLLKECEPLKHNPYLYMKFESEAQDKLKQSLDNKDDISFKESFLKELGLKKNAEKYTSEFHRRLAVFLWFDLAIHSFKNSKSLSLYARTCVEDVSRSRLYIEEASFGGNDLFEFEDFSEVDLSGGNFSGVRFENCNFSFTNLKNTELGNSSFICCKLKDVSFDDSNIENSHWIKCENVDQLNTEPVLYETIADLMVKGWKEKDSQAQSDWNPEQLFKMYKTILDKHEKQKTITDDIRQRLIEKGSNIRNEVEKDVLNESGN